MSRLRSAFFITFYMNINKLYSYYKLCSAISIDSRIINKNEMFFALKGDNFDGNQYALQALEKGCKYAVVDDENLKNNKNCLLVDNVEATLQELAKHHRKTLNIPTIAITGSNGKTTTKELTAAVLSKQYKTWFTKGNLNNHIGVPLTLLSMPDNTEIAIIEMGANHIGEIDFLCNIALPDFGIITNVGKAHLEGFGTFENIMKTKAELYRFIEKFGKFSFFNSDNNYLKNMLKKGQFVSYGTDRNDFVFGRNIIAKPFLEFEWSKKENPKWNKVKTQLTGAYNFENAMAAVCIGTYFNVTSEKIKNALSEYIPQNNRSQLIYSAKNKILLDAYNANPASMKVAIDNFNEIEGKNKVLIIGEMKELGKESRKEHELLLELINAINFDKCFLIGKEFQSLTFEYPKYIWFETIIQLSDHLKKNLLSEKFIFIKGSRGNQLEKILKEI